MKVLEILFGQSTKFIRFHHPGGGVHAKYFMDEITKRYSFVETPQTLQELDLSNGVRFFHGRHEENVIRELRIYERGLYAESNASTDVSERFLEDAIRWAKDELGFLVRDDIPIQTAYCSRLEVEFSSAAAIENVNRFGVLVADKLRSYGHDVPDFEQSGFSWHIDAKNILPFPIPFRVERREGSAWDSNSYFTSSSLRTNDHIELLQQLEHLLCS